MDPVAATLRPLLAEQLQRLRRRFTVHGVGTCVLLPAAAILLFFTLDHSLRLPLPIRLLHTAVGVALVAFAAIRYLRYPLTRHFAEIDVAAWVERTFPQLHQRLVSALQLHAMAEGDLRNQSQAMVDQLLAETAAQAQRLPLDRLFDDRRTKRVLAGAALLVVTLTAGAWTSPRAASAFVLRHLGIEAEYPKQTQLEVKLPPAGPDLHREDDGNHTRLMVPAGADLHVVVLARGTVPEQVFLDVSPLNESGDDSGRSRSLAMTPRPGDQFRYVFRRLSGSFEFHARGGDDESGDRRVTVRTVHPPQVATLRATIKPPAYTGIESGVQSGGAIEALVGSEVSLSLTTTAAVDQATMVFLEGGRRIEMLPSMIEDDSGTATVYRCEFVIETSDRYQIDLLAAAGLRNPNPGVYPISALADYAPVGRWLLPDDESLLLLPNALLCVRVEVRDDFGLLQAQLAIDRSGTRTLDRSLLPQSPGPTTAAILTELLEVKELLGPDTTANDSLMLQFALRDNRDKGANATDLPARIVQIVDASQLVAAIGKGFRTLREEVGQALEIQSDRRARLLDLLAREGVPPGEFSQLLTGIEVGQGRVLSASDRVHRGLMRAFDLHLWNRLEASQAAEQVVELYREHSRTLREPIALDPAFYRDLRQRRSAGTLGAMETTLDPILEMIAVADRLATTAGPEAARLLAEAQVAGSAASQKQTLTLASQVQAQIEQSLQQLLLRLEEWNDYQDLIQETRALRDRQLDLRGRTEDLRGTK